MSSVVISGNTSGSVTLAAPDVAGTTTLTLPATSGTVTVADGSGNINTAGTVTATSFVGNGASLTGIAGGFSNMQVFTSSGTFTVPAGITKVKVTVVGGGGNSGSATYGSPSASSSSGGGGGGGAAIEIISGLSPGATISVTVGGAGGTSSFGAYCSATGGGASPNVNGGITGTGGVGGSGSGGDINFTGSRGQGSDNLSINSQSTGGSSILGLGQSRDNSTSSAQAGLNYGGGASGAHRSAPLGTTPGATGGSGIVIVEY